MGKNLHASKVLQLGILVYWALFWIFNVLDKFIGERFLFWVGRNRYAQIYKYFASTGLDNPIIAHLTVFIVAAMQIVAVVFLIYSIINFFKNNEKKAQQLFFYACLAGMIVFTFFSLGDQVFGDRFELMEHGIFWTSIIISYLAYAAIPKLNDVAITGRKLQPMVIIMIILSLAAYFSLHVFDLQQVEASKNIIIPTKVDDNFYRMDVPFISRRGVWEDSMEAFVAAHPNEKVISIYTAPNALLSKADNAVIYIITEDK